MAIVFCPACGKKINTEDGKYCPACGKLAVTEAEEAAASVTTGKAQEEQPPETAAEQMQQDTESTAQMEFPAMEEAGAARPPMPALSQSGYGWISFMRMVLWNLFSLLALASFIAGCVLIAKRGSVSVGLGVMLGGTLLAFITIAGGMILLDNAINLDRLARNSEKILKLLQKKD